MGRVPTPCPETRSRSRAEFALSDVEWKFPMSDVPRKNRLHAHTVIPSLSAPSRPANRRPRSHGLGREGGLMRRDFKNSRNEARPTRRKARLASEIPVAHDLD